MSAVSGRLGGDRAVSVALAAFETIVRSRRVHSGFAAEMIQSAVEQFSARNDCRPAVDGCDAVCPLRRVVDAAGTMGVDLQSRSVCVVRFLPRQMFAWASGISSAASPA